jgi:hypothetical protein
MQQQALTLAANKFLFLLSTFSALDRSLRIISRSRGKMQASNQQHLAEVTKKIV